MIMKECRIKLGNDRMRRSKTRPETIRNLQREVPSIFTTKGDESGIGPTQPDKVKRSMRLD